MLRVVTGCAVLLGWVAIASAAPRIDCSVQELYGAERALLSLDDQLFELTTDVELAFEADLLTPESFCAFQDDDFVAFILPVPRLPEETPVAPLPGVDGGMIEPWSAPDPWAGRDAKEDGAMPMLDDERQAPLALVERAQPLVWSPDGVSEPAPSPSREIAPDPMAGGCSAAPGQPAAWWALLGFLALVRRRTAR